MNMPGRRNLLRLIALMFAVAWLVTWAGLEARAFGPPRKSIVAYAGEPFGVGRIDLEYDTGNSLILPPDAVCWLSDKAGRVLYPVCETAQVHTGVNQQNQQVSRVSGWFLFHGDQPLAVTLDADTAYFRWEGKPATQKEEHARLLKEWWNQYSTRALALSKSEAHPIYVENYLTTMLGRRLKLSAPDLTNSLTGRRDLDETLGLLVGTESIRLAMQKAVTLGRPKGQEAATEPLPQAALPPPVVVPKLPDDVEIELIAEHVPQECFYVRCRDFKNYRWLRENVDDWGGNLRDIASIRGIDYGIRERIEGQMSLKEGILARLFGNFVMTDMAIIGSDTFFREGPAIGVLFQANRSPALGRQILTQRRQTLESRADATEKTVKIADHDVSLISTPDNSLRSFYAVDELYHLVTNSETIARRFFEAGAGKESLGALPAFRHARHQFPLSREDDLFVYFSDPFFAQLISPHYRIEMTRRALAEVDLEVLTLARLAAVAEQKPAKTIADLIAGGFLPQNFETRPDGSRPVLNADGERLDSLRGARRTFLPIPDVSIKTCTPGEAQSYRQFSNMYSSLWQRMDPVSIAVRRNVDKDHPDREHVVFDLHISPLAEKYGSLARWLANPDQLQFRRIPGNLVAAELLINFSLTGKTPLRGTVGLQDVDIPFVVNRGRVLSNHWNIETPNPPPVYLAAERPGGIGGDEPRSAITNRPLKLDQNETGKVAEGLLGPHWLGWNRDFEVIAWNEKVPGKILPAMKLEKATRPAQLRLQIADLNGKQVSPHLQAEAYCRARQTSQSNVNLMHSLMNQLHVPADQALTAYRELLAGEPVCPLKGKYVRHETGPGPVRWNSTEWKAQMLSQVNAIPAAYRNPILEWFRGMDVELTVDPRASVLSTHIEVDIVPGIRSE